MRVRSRYAILVVALSAGGGTACGAPNDSRHAGGASDAGDIDASSTALAPCELSDAAIDAELSVNADAGVTTIFPAEQGAWTVISQDGDCAMIRPVAPPQHLVTTAPRLPGLYCDDLGPVVDGEGDLAFNWYALSGVDQTFGITLVRPDGGSTTLSTSSTAFGPSIGVPVARQSGFWLDHQYCDASSASQYLFHELAPTGELGPKRPAEYEAILANPDGGYVEVKWVIDPDYNATQLRWADEDLSSRTEWRSVARWPKTPAMNRVESIAVSNSGDALVLSFLSPSGFGAQPPPSSWRFAGQWVATNGPLGTQFSPAGPEWYSSGQVQWFAGWGTFLPLLDGGVAAHHDAVFGDGHPVSPAGWYAFFSEGGRQSSPPVWLQNLETAAVLNRRTGYAATERDATSCSRTALLISATGQRCYSMDLRGSDDCASTAMFSEDGTFVLRNVGSCRVTWWPGLARQQ